MNFEIDILSEIDWESINIDEIKNLSLQNKRNKEQEIVLGLSNEEKELLKETGEQRNQAL
jgi:type III restriction enzyme